jgi:hypothetical protein
MNLKNHTTMRYWPLTGDRGEAPAYVHGQTYKWNLKDIPPVTRRMANYVVGIVLTWVGKVKYESGTPSRPPIDWAEVTRALFQSCEVQQSMFGTPVSSNHYLGCFMDLFSFVANGMERPVPWPPPLVPGQAEVEQRHSWFIPLCSLLGMKGHHTAQLACCYDRAQFVLRTEQSGVITGLSFPADANGYLKVSAAVLPEPEVRLGAGTQFLRYTQTASPSGSIVTLDALGNSSTLEGVEPGAGIAMLLWMGNQRGFNGAGAPALLEYLNVPFRDIVQTHHLDPFYLEWLNAQGGLNSPWLDDMSSTADFAGGPYDLSTPLYDVGQIPNSDAYGVTAAEFLPIITPHKFLQTSKLQVVQGSQIVGIKHSASAFSGEHVFTALQYHSWTPAKIEDVLRKAIDSGVVQAVWGTNDIVPSVKVELKQPANSINPTKTRFFPTTWVPKVVQPAPPTQ